MQIRIPTLYLLLPTALLCLQQATADTIYLTDGTAIDEVKIQVERLDVIEYKADKKTETVASDKVLFTVFDSKPSAVDSADAAIEEELILDALDDLENFLDGLESSPRRWPWSRPYALYRLMDVHEIMGEVEKLVETADRLAELEPDSRYVPLAQLRKAQALFDAGKASQAQKAVADLNQLIQAKLLSERWKLAAELSEVLYDEGLKGAQKESRLESISGKAGLLYPVERNRAEVALGEERLRAQDVKGARKIFEGVAADPKADSRTLAAAYLGLGDCFWTFGERRAEEDAGKEDLAAALNAYMRVVVIYKAEQRYVPKAMFFAGRCFQLIGGEMADEHATKLYNKLIRFYGGSKWALEARGFRKK